MQLPVRICLLFACTLALFASCSKRKAASAVTSAATSEQPQQTLPPEYIKLSHVLSGLSERAKAAVPNGDPAEFLRDLAAVLSEDDAFTLQNGGVSLLYLCDKKHYLPDGYAPEDLVLLEKNSAYNVNRSNLYLRAGVEPALHALGEAARAAGVTLLVSSTYRSYDYQVTVYNRLVALDGQEQADRESARPGTSQHQLGTVVDFGSIDPSWEPTAACQWLLQNAARYGWSLSFPDGYEDVTGYEYECWHFRYIGRRACDFQKKWFGDVQQFMLEFLAAWKQIE